MPLSTTYNELREHAGRKLGYTGDTTVIDADAEKKDDVAKALTSGRRKFYTANRPGKPPHVWSFLQRELKLTLLSGQPQVDLPVDFLQLAGKLTYAAGTELPAIAVVDEGEIRNLRAGNDATGAPIYAAVRAHAVNYGERYELLLYPTPDANYEVTGRYSQEPPALDANHPLPAGGALHSETILAAVLCACDEHLNPEAIGAGESIHCQRFAQLLEGSIELDQQIAGEVDGGAWPIDAKKTDVGLCTTRAELDQAIAMELGFGPNSAGWTHGQQVEIGRIRGRALRRVYVPDSLGDGRPPHQWTFLTPTFTITTVAEEAVVPLPHGIASVDGPLTYPLGSSECYPAVQLVGELDIRRKQQDNDVPDRPRYAALRTRAPQSGHPSGQELIFYPVPDAAYDLEVSVRIDPYDLPSPTSRPAACGDLSEVLYAAVLLAASETSGKPRPDYERRYQAALAAAIQRDRQAQSPRTVGVLSSWEGEYDVARIDNDQPEFRRNRLVFED